MIGHSGGEGRRRPGERDDGCASIDDDVRRRSTTTTRHVDDAGEGKRRRRDGVERWWRENAQLGACARCAMRMCDAMVRTVVFKFQKPMQRDVEHGRRVGRRAR